MIINNYPKSLEFTEIKPFNPSWPKKLKLFEKARGKNIYYIPRIFELQKENKTKYKLPGFLRPKQKEAVEKLLQYNYGIMLSWVGSGKSYMIAAIAETYEWRTLVIAPKKEIAKWLLSKFKELWLEAEIFDKKKFDEDNLPKILIMVSKSVNLYWEELHLDYYYKQVLIDEVHMELTKNRIHFFIHYKYNKIYWFTWTPELNNFPSEALFVLFNNTIVDSWIWPQSPELYIYTYPRKQYWAEDWAELVEMMYWDKDRLCKFVQMVVEVMKKEDRKMWIVFVDRKDIAEALAYAITECWVEAKAYTGKLSSKKRTEALEYLTKHKGVMVATYQTVWTWFDWPPLNTAFYFMFVKFKAQVKQAVWRILRWAENPEYYDFQDMSLYWQTRERTQAYREMWLDKPIYKYSLKTNEIYLKCMNLYPDIQKFKKEKSDDYLFV